ncbi:MAG: molybdopterin cofactor-binding domain-containing protein [Pseudomonadota bacterium]
MTLVQSKRSHVTRRWLLKAAPTAAAGLMLYSCAPELAAQQASRRLNPFVEFTPDGRVILTCPEAEMGQDVFTGLAKVLADEIGLEWVSVEVVRAPHHSDFYNQFGGQTTGGSRSMRTWYQPFREMGARVRLAFLQAAAQRWETTTSALSVVNSKVIGGPRGASYALAQLLADVATSDMPAQAPLKTNAQLTLISRNLQRKDIPQKVTGAAHYGADVRLPGMLHAAVKLIPEQMGDASVSNLSDAKAMSGVLGVQQFGNAVAVTGKTWWAANRAVRRLKLQPTNPSSASTIDDVEVDNVLSDAINSIYTPLSADTLGAKTIKATYSAPFLSHMCMETMTATAWVSDDAAKIWVSTQAPSRFAQRVATLLAIDVEQVTLENAFLGGGFGRKGTDMQALDLAVHLSKSANAPVQVMMDRPADILSDQFRPAAKFALSAAMSKDNTIAEVKTASAMQSIAKARLPQFYKKGRPEFPEQGIFPYSAEKSDHRWQEVDLPVSIGFWRSVNGTHFPFAGESFADELAHLAGEDPLVFRLSKLGNHPRLRAVLERAASMADWQRERRQGTGLGIGLYEEWGSASAQIAEVSVSDGKLQVNKVWIAIDCGQVIAPDTVRAQAVSGVHCGLSAALFGRITLVDGQAVEANFDDYRVMDMQRSPQVEAALMDSDLPPGGVGEIGTPGTAPAIANAIFAASGQRIRSLPLSQSLSV